MNVETVEQFLKRGGVIEVYSAPKKGMKRKPKKNSFNKFERTLECIKKKGEKKC